MTYDPNTGEVSEMPAAYRTSAELGEIATALAKAQTEIENVAKQGENPHFRSKYATLAAVLDEVRPKLAKHGIMLLQMPINGANSNIGVVTRLLHSSGQWIESTLYVAPAKFDAQGAGSTITYLRRYAAMAMTGVAADDDDDGEAAVNRPSGVVPARSRSVKPLAAANSQDAPKGEPRPIPVVNRDWIAWGGRFVAAVANAQTRDDLDRWVNENAANLNGCEAEHEKAYMRVKANIDMAQARLPDFLEPGDER